MRSSACEACSGSELSQPRRRIHAVEGRPGLMRVFAQAANRIGHLRVKPMRGQARNQGDVVKFVGRSEKVTSAGLQKPVNLRKKAPWFLDVLKHIVRISKVKVSIGERNP